VFCDLRLPRAATTPCKIYDTARNLHRASLRSTERKTHKSEQQVLPLLVVAASQRRWALVGEAGGIESFTLNARKLFTTMQKVINMMRRFNAIHQ
jgi:hypothetical protein